MDAYRLWIVIPTDWILLRPHQGGIQEAQGQIPAAGEMCRNAIPIRQRIGGRRGVLLEDRPIQAQFLAEFHQTRSADRLRIGRDERYPVSNCEQYGMERVCIYRYRVLDGRDPFERIEVPENLIVPGMLAQCDGGRHEADHWQVAMDPP